MWNDMCVYQSMMNETIDFNDEPVSEDKAIDS